MPTPKHNTPTEQERYAALLALTSQPPSDVAPVVDWRAKDLTRLNDAERRALQAHFDAHPEEFDAFLKQHRSVHPGSARKARRWADWLLTLWPAPVRYALAIGASVVLIGGITLLQITRPSALVTHIEAGYEHVQSGAPQEVVLPWEQESTSLGFSPRSTASSSALSFAAGLLIAEQRVQGERIETELDRDPYFLLGEWNIIVSSALSESESAPTFWSQQREVHALLTKAVRTQGSEAFVTRHLQTLAPLLANMAQGERRARTAHAMANELRAFREQFASIDEGAVRAHIHGAASN